MDLMNTVMDMAGIYFTTILRWVFMILALFILARPIRSLLRARNTSADALGKSHRPRSRL